MSETKTKEKVEIPRFRQITLDGRKARQLHEIFEIINEAMYPEWVNLYFTNEHLLLKGLSAKQSLFITVLIKREYFLEYSDMVKNTAFSVNVHSLSSAFDVPYSRKTELDLVLVSNPAGGDDLEFHVSHHGYFGVFSTDVLLEEFIEIPIDSDAIEYSGEKAEFTVKYPALAEAIEWLNAGIDESIDIIFNDDDELYLKWSNKEYTLNRLSYTIQEGSRPAESFNEYSNLSTLAAIDKLPGHHPHVKISERTSKELPLYYRKTTSGGNIEIRMLISPVIKSE